MRLTVKILIILVFILTTVWGVSTLYSLFLITKFNPHLIWLYAHLVSAQEVQTWIFASYGLLWNISYGGKLAKEIRT